MVSAFQARIWGLFREMTDGELEDVNKRRLEVDTEYKSTNAAMELYGTTTKKPLEDNSAFLWYFEVGADKDGYWNYNYMAIQFEDLIDCLVVLYPEHDFCVLFDQSSGHGRRREGGLTVVQGAIGKKWGGKNPSDFRPTVLTAGCFGPFMVTGRKAVGDVQRFNFEGTDQGPAKMSASKREETKHDIVVGREDHERTIPEILTVLKQQHNFNVRKRYRRKEVDELARTYNIPLVVEQDKIKHGWLGKPKGMFQVLWERGWIDPDRPMKDYTVNGKKEHLDDSGNVKEEFKHLCLTHLLGQCEDFKNEMTAMEYLADEMTKDDTHNC